MKNISISLLKRSLIKKESRLDSIEFFSEIDLFIHIWRWLSHLGHEREIRLNLKNKLNLKRKRKTKHSLHFHTIFTLFTIFTIILFFIRYLRSLALATWNRSLFDFLDLLCSKSRRCFLFSIHFLFRRDFFFRVSLCLDHVNEIRSLIVIRSMIIFVFFINFVGEAKSVTLCSLTKSKRRCLNAFI